MTTGNLIVLVLLLNRLSLSFLTSVLPSQPMRGNTVGSIEQLLRAYRFQGDAGAAPCPPQRVPFVPLHGAWF